MDKPVDNVDNSCEQPVKELLRRELCKLQEHTARKPEKKGRYAGAKNSAPPRPAGQPFHRKTERLPGLVTKKINKNLEV